MRGKLHDHPWRDYHVSVHPIDVAWLYYRLWLLRFLPRRRPMIRRLPTVGRIDMMPPRFATEYSFFRRLFLLLHFQAHTNFRFGFHKTAVAAVLSKNWIFRDNPFPRLLSEYFVSYESFHEIFAPRISYVVITIHCVQQINASFLANRFSKCISGS